jgi:hypothetical protein
VKKGEREKERESDSERERGGERHIDRERELTNIRAGSVVRGSHHHPSVPSPGPQKTHPIRTCAKALISSRLEMQRKGQISIRSFLLKQKTGE